MVKYVLMDKDFKEVYTKNIAQKDLSAECWLIQFQGLNACKSCEYLDHENCGGKNIRKTLTNKLGVPIPE